MNSIINLINIIIITIIQFAISKKLKHHSFKLNDKRKKLLIDCSFIYNTDLNTGIQRVTNNIIHYAYDYSKEQNVEILTVVLLDGFITEVDLNKKTIVQEYQPQLTKLIKKVHKKLSWYKLAYCNATLINEKDIILMLDSSWSLNIWKSIENAKNKGARIIDVVYDLIPINYPQFSDETLVKMFIEYLGKTTQYCDGYITISKTVMLDLKSYLRSENIDLSQYSFNHFKLGTDFKPTEYLIGGIRKQLQKVYAESQSVYLIVSTIEPRKNHQYLFSTFQELWKGNVDVTLVIVGRIGWKTEKLIQQIVEHPQYESRLWIFNDLDDNELKYCYSKSKALLFPSYVEGFGLPIIESLQHGLPVLASDTPVHHEVGGDAIEYFDIDSIASLENKIQDIEKNNTLLKQPSETRLVVNTWSESTKELLDKVLLLNRDNVLKV